MRVRVMGTREIGRPPFAPAASADPPFFSLDTCPREAPGPQGEIASSREEGLPK